MGFRNVAINYIFSWHKGLQYYTLMIANAILADNQCFVLGIQSMALNTQTPCQRNQRVI